MQGSLTVVMCVDHASVVGGKAKVAIESAIGLRRRGVRSVLFAASAPVDPRLGEEGVEVVCLNQHDILGNPSRAAAAWQGTWNGPAATALKAMLANLPRERTIVHVHGWAKALSPSIVVPLRSSGLPALYTIHEYSLFCPNVDYYSKSAVCKLKPMSSRCLATHCDSRNYPYKIWRFGRLFAARTLLRMPSAFSDYICISDYQADIVAPYIPPGAIIHRLSVPIEASDLGPKPTPSSGEFVFVGRLSPEKGASLFAEAAARAGVPPTFIGDGPIAHELRAKYSSARFSGGCRPKRRAKRCGRRARWCSLRYGTRGSL